MGVLDRVARYVRQGREGVVPARPPYDVVSDLLALQPALPQLEGVCIAPAFLPDWRLLATPGYDPGSRLYLAPAGLEGVTLELPPAEALALLRDDLFGDLPLADEASLARALACASCPSSAP